MKFHTLAGGAVAALAILFVTAPADAASLHKNVVHAEQRPVEGGRDVQVLVPQAEIKSDINPSNVVVATGGGLLGALIDAKINADRAKAAELAIQPVRAALTGFDVDATASDTTKAALAKVDWFTCKTQGFGRDGSLTGMGSVLDASAASQTAFFTYAYDMSPDFSAVRVRVTMQFVDKATPAGKKPDARFAPKFSPYAETITSVITLSAPSKVAAENAARWSADNGALARKGIGMGFANVGVLIPRALSLTEDDLVAMTAKDKKNTALGGFMGRLQEQNDSGSLLYAGDLIHVQTLPQ